MQEFIETKHRSTKNKKINVQHIGQEEKIKMSTPITSAAKLHKNTIKNSRGAIRQLRKEKRQTIKAAKKAARQEFKIKQAPHKHSIKMAKLLLKQVKTTIKLQKLNDK